MPRLLSITSCFFILSFMTNAQSTNLFDKLVFNDNKNTLPYRLLKPVNPGAKEKFPLVIFLHGAGERGNDNEAQLKHITDLFLDLRNRGKFPCYVLAPQCAKDLWWAEYRGKTGITPEPTKPMAMVINLIEKILKEYPIDPSRIYVTGVSMGGFGTWDLIGRFPNKFAAAIPICGGGDENTATTIKHVPIWAFHGAKDDVVSPDRSRSMISALQKAGGLPGYTEYPDIGHASWIQAYQEPHLLPWLFKQKLSRQSAN